MTRGMMMMTMVGLSRPTAADRAGRGLGSPGRRSRVRSSASQSQDPYRVLRVSQTATREEIREAYLRLIKKLHPDVVQGDPEDANQQAAAINAAYACLQQSWQKQDERRSQQQRASRDSDASPFEVAEEEPLFLFVNPTQCRACGKCRDTAPNYFARVSQGVFAGRSAVTYQAHLSNSEDAEYLAYCAKEQCPFGAIYYVTPLQEEQLSSLLEAIELEPDLQQGLAMLDNLLTRANFANAEWYRDENNN